VQPIGTIGSSVPCITSVLTGNGSPEAASRSIATRARFWAANARAPNRVVGLWTASGSTAKAAPTAGSRERRLPSYCPTGGRTVGTNAHPTVDTSRTQPGWVESIAGALRMSRSGSGRSLSTYVVATRPPIEWA